MNRDTRGPFPLWQLALYIAVLGILSMLLAPLTSLWWIVPLLGAAVPVVLAVVQARAHQGSAADEERMARPALEVLSRDRAALPETQNPSAAARPAALESGLSDREMEVLALLAAGQTNAEVAEALFISVGTVKSHSANIYRKLEAKNRTEAVARASEMGILP